MSARPNRRRVARLALGAVAVVAVWCGLLPRLLEWPPIAGHVALMEARRVDPAAMYYTELERLPLRPAWVEHVLTIWPEDGRAGTRGATAPGTTNDRHGLAGERGVGSPTSRSQ